MFGGSSAFNSVGTPIARVRDLQDNSIHYVKTATSVNAPYAFMCTDEDRVYQFWSLKDICLRLEEV